MKTPCTAFIAWWVASLLCPGAPAELSIERDGANVTLSWTTTSLTAAPATALYPEVQVTTSGDLIDWSPVGDPTPTRIGGDPSSHQLIVPLVEETAYFRLEFAVRSSDDDLAGLDLSETEILQGDFGQADLTGVNFSGADLRGANFVGAKLTDTIFDDAILDGAIFSGLPGAPDAPATDALPLFNFVPERSGYSTDYPNLEGFPISYNLALIVLTKEASRREINTLVSSLGACLVGMAPGDLNARPPLVILKLPLESHSAMTAALEQLRNDPIVQHATPDTLLGIASTPNPRNPFQDWNDWKDGEYNHNMRAIQAPQMWNFREALQKKGNEGDDRESGIAFIDSAFPEHREIALNRLPTVGEDRSGGIHGSHVVGVATAAHEDAYGICGVTSFAKTWISSLVKMEETEEQEGRVSWGEQFIETMRAVLKTEADVRVINISLAYNWGQSWINPKDSEAARDLADEQGATFSALVESANMPLIVVAAGNDSNDFGTEPNWDILPAAYASPMANAGLRQGNHNILVVGAINTWGGAFERASLSNVGGHLSAPGQWIYSCDGSGSGFVDDSGTSQAAPHVTGLINFLIALKPDLSNTDLRILLLTNLKSLADPDGVPGIVPQHPEQVGGMIQCWHAAMSVDFYNENSEVLQMLLDIDDGTPDGSLRQRYRLESDDKSIRSEPWEKEWSEDGGDPGGEILKGPGDGKIDMADFRRWRDWHLYLNHDTAHKLDGGNSRKKQDANRNRVPESAQLEGLYPRGDFNGDGSVSTEDDSGANVPLYEGKKTDLQVFQESDLFHDRFYSTNDLDQLIESGDLRIVLPEILPEFLSEIPNDVRIEITDTSGSFHHSRTFPYAEDLLKDVHREELLCTAPASALTVKISFLRGIRSRHTYQKKLSLDLGQDAFWVLSQNDLVKE